jgi:hypothetical protein
MIVHTGVSASASTTAPVSPTILPPKLRYNENTALAQLYGVELLEYRDILNLSEEGAFRDNTAILAGPTREASR